MQAQREIVIEAGRTELNYWKDLWHYRELLYFLTWRDTVVRYRQTAIGVAWAVLRPVLIMIVFTILFGRLMKIPSDGIPYPILVFAGLLPWQFFANAFAEAGNSLVSNASMLSKIYFPRLIVPASAILTTLVDFVISGSILVVLMAWYGFWPDWRIVTLPLFVAIAIAAALGAGLWVAALNVAYRDFRYVIPFVVQFGLYISPVGFASSIVPEQWRLLYSLNPMVGVIDGFRWALFGNSYTPYLPGIGLSLMVIAIVFVSGLAYFRRTEKTFTDVI